MAKSPELVARKLDQASTSLELIEGLKACGLDDADIGLACNISLYVVARWRRGESTPQVEQEFRLRSLGECCLQVVEISGHDLERTAGILERLKVVQLMSEKREDTVSRMLQSLRQRAGSASNAHP